MWDIGTQMNDLLQAALHYAELGYAVFPCVPGRKEPLTKNGFLDATSEIEQIELWWQRHPNANIAIATEGLLVVDVDGPENPWLVDDPDRLAELATGCVSVTPRGGRHYVFRQPKGADVSLPGGPIGAVRRRPRRAATCSCRHRSWVARYIGGPRDWNSINRSIVCPSRQAGSLRGWGVRPRCRPRRHVPRPMRLLGIKSPAANGTRHWHAWRERCAAWGCHAPRSWPPWAAPTSTVARLHCRRPRWNALPPALLATNRIRSLWRLPRTTGRRIFGETKNLATSRRPILARFLST